MSNLGSLDVISADILDRRDSWILIYLNFFSGVRGLQNGSTFEQGLQVSHELQLQMLNARVFCILFSSLLPLHFSFHCVHLPLN